MRLDELPDRARQKITAGPDGCWTWTGAKDSSGSGSIRLSDPRRANNYRKISARRYVYELAVRKLPAGARLWALCRQRTCVNPAHMRVDLPPSAAAAAVRSDVERARYVAQVRRPAPGVCSRCGWPSDG